MRAWVVAIVVGLAACGSSGGSAATSTPKGPTVRQVASVVAELGPAFRTASDYEDSCSTLVCLAADARLSRADVNAHRAARFYRALRAERPYPAEVKAL